MKKIKRLIARICIKLFGRVRWLNFLKLIHNIDKNSYYDQLSDLVMQKILLPNSTCVDVGCYEGAILERMMKHSPQGRFLAFEPLPDHYKNLIPKFQNKNVNIYNLALSDTKGTSSFNYVISNPAYSGLKKRPYDRPHEQDCSIEVHTDLLDDILKQENISCIDLIKIDVEGGEYAVLKGAVNSITKCKPAIIFEHGPGSAKAYEFSSDDLYTLLSQKCGLKIYLLQDWLTGKPPLAKAKFKSHVQNKTNYYFMAYK